MFDAERMDGLDSSAQRQRAKVVGTDFGRRTKGGERFRRCDEEASDFAGRLLALRPVVGDRFWKCVGSK